MIFTLTVLSGLLAWGVLLVLSISLLLLKHALEDARTSLQQVTMGVRAIEHQVAPLGRYTETSADSIRRTAADVTELGAELGTLGRSFERVLPALERRQ